MSDTNRRDFLKASGLVVMAGSAGYLGTEQFLHAADSANVEKNPGDEKQKPTLVTIFLRGGADSLNAFVPVGDDLYYKMRPAIGLRVKPRGNEKAAIEWKKDKYWALNPGFEAILPLLEEGKAVPILNVGSVHDTRSHFSAQDYMERGIPGNNSSSQGWLNRYLALSAKPYDAPLRGLSAMSLLPRSLRGSYPVLAGNNRTEQMDLFGNLYSPKNMVNMDERESAGPVAGSRLEDRPTGKADGPSDLLTADLTREIITTSGTNAVERLRALEKAYQTPNAASYPGGQLGGQLAAIARVIKANVGLEVAQADFDGWDHHRGQGGSNGPHTNMLGHLSGCIAAFTKDLGPRMDKVMILVMSEFGRTVEENGTEGTDHGRGGFMLAVGNMLNGGKFMGQWNGMAEMSGEYRFQPVHTDYRAVFAEAVARLYHWDPFAKELFPGYKHQNGKEFLGYANQLPEM